MTNTIAVFLGALILAGLAIDYAMADFAGSVFLTRKLIALIEWLAFWR